LPWPTRFGFTFRKEIPFQKRDLALALALSRPAGGRPRLVRAALAEPVEAGLVMDDSLGTFRRGRVSTSSTNEAFNRGDFFWLLFCVADKKVTQGSG